MTLLIASFFDLEVNGISLVDPEDLTPPNPDAAWLMRETADGWTYDRRIKKAQADLYRLLEGWVPSETELADAPLLRRCRIVTLGDHLALHGFVEGHPGLGDGRRVQTSAIVALDTDNYRWVRTLSRFYRVTL